MKSSLRNSISTSFLWLQILQPELQAAILPNILNAISEEQ